MRTNRRKRKARPLMTVIAAAAALSAVTISSHQQGSPSHPAGTRFAGQGRNQAGMVVVKDPETGEFREPTAQELIELQAPAQPFSLRAAQTALEPQPITTETGFQGLQLGDDQMTFTVATRGADGRVQVAHAAGKTEADRLVAGQRGLVAGKETPLER